jgi:leader peptidase (prepilin peptidase) / N-methyltransferase
MPLDTLPPRLFWTLLCAAFAFGCCVGSYLNVVIYRLPLGLSTHNPKRSFCPLCKYHIPFYHNIPILSWLLLRGRCASCKSGISIRYPMVELLTGVLFAAVMLRYGYDWKVFAGFTFIALCVAGSYIDIDHQILPHEITWGGAAAGLVASTVVPASILGYVGAWWQQLLVSLASAALGYALIWVVIQLGKLAFGKLKLAFDKPEAWSVSQPEGSLEPILKVADAEERWSEIFSRTTDRLVIKAESAQLGDNSYGPCLLKISEDSVTVTPLGAEPIIIPLENIPQMSGTCTALEQPREAMGLGDANWMACVGAFLGWKGVLFAIFGGSIIGALIGLLMICIGRRAWAGRIPFGPYLAAGAVIWLFRGPEFLNWYLNLARGSQEVGG